MMKLPKPQECLLSCGRGNVKQQTTLVEGQGIVLRTRVRLPSGPLGTKVQFKNRNPSEVFRRVFMISGKRQRCNCTFNLEGMV